MPDTGYGIVDAGRHPVHQISETMNHAVARERLEIETGFGGWAVMAIDARSHHELLNRGGTIGSCNRMPLSDATDVHCGEADHEPEADGRWPVGASGHDVAPMQATSALTEEPAAT